MDLRKAVATAVLGGLLAGGGLGCATTSRPQQEEAERNAKRAGAHLELASDHVAAGRIELALRELLTAANYDPNNVRVQHALGITYLQKGRPAEAEQHLLRAVEIRPEYHDARYNLSALYLNQRRYEAAIQHAEILYDDATYTMPWRALTNWGWGAYKLGRVDEARRHLGYAREYNRRYWPTLLNLGILEAEQGDDLAAVRYFEEALALEPGPSATAEVSYRLAKIYVGMGRRKDALSYLRTAIVKAPSDPWGKKSEEYMNELR